MAFISWKNLDNRDCPFCEVGNNNWCGYYDNSSLSKADLFICNRSHTYKGKDYRKTKVLEGRTYYVASNNTLPSYSSNTEEVLNPNNGTEQEISDWYAQLINALQNYYRNYNRTPEFGLNNTHAADLASRGVSLEAFRRLGHYTIPAGFKIHFDNKLPGFLKIAANTWVFDTDWDGLLIPGYSMDYTYSGFQIKTQSKTRKYIYGAVRMENRTEDKEYYSSHYKGTNKLPYTFINPCRDVTTIYITEGFLKATIAAVKNNVAVFGTAGGTVNRDEELIRLFNKYPKAEYIIFPDAASGLNPNIHASNIRHYDALSRLGASVYFGDYGQFYNKEAGDIDEKNNIEFRKVSKKEYVLKKESDVFTIKQEDSEFVAGRKYTVKDLSKAYYELVGQRNIKVVHDCSGTGAGKSYTMANFNVAKMRLENKRFKLVYSIPSPRNPTIENHPFTLLQGRHDGLSKIENRWKAGLDASTEHQPSNCERFDLFSQFRNQGMDTTTICNKCPLRMKCIQGSGEGYGYLNQQRKALASKSVLAHTTSIPRKYLDENSLLVIDEFTSINAFPTLRLNIDAVSRMALVLKGKQFRDFIDSLLVDYIERKQPTVNYTKQFSEAIKDNGLLDSIKALVANEVEWFKDAQATIEALLPRKINQAQRNLIKNKLPTIYFERIFDAICDGNYAITIEDSDLIIKSTNKRVVNNIRNSGTIIIQDATTPTETIAAFLGINIDEIVTIKKEQDINENLELIKVTGLGRLGRQRSKAQHYATQRIREKIGNFFGVNNNDVGVIDVGVHAKEGDLVYFSNARGSNAFEAKKVLTLIGNPFMNIDAALSNFQALFKKPLATMQSKEFKQYYQNCVQEEISQAVGRLRANRRLNEQLKVVFLGDNEVGYDCKEITANQIDNTISTRLCKLGKRLDAIKEVFIKRKEEFSQNKVAEELGMKLSTLTNWVSRNFNSWNGLKETLGLVPS